MTVATALLALGFAMQAAPLDGWVDTCRDPHLSDLLHAVAIMAACWLLGEIPLRDPKRVRWQIPWRSYTLAMWVIAVVASGGGTKPIQGAQVYQNAFAVMTLSATALIVGTTIRGLKGAWLLAALTFAAVAGLVSAGATIWTLTVAPEAMVENYEIMLLVTSILVAVGVSAAGLYGVWLAVRGPGAGR
ncbi:hypothetical protein [Nocardia higoensis]|uniref:hypothetical protein n=1 Tax=Nocardia higoensis TaxID=228599 RepID=UPI001E47A6B0|nr:hypothetical protein [Nocardia higoensis]